jgi:hypothetical protein
MKNDHDPSAIFRENYYGPRFPTPRTDDPVLAFREGYAAARQNAHGHDLGMANDDVDPDDDDVRNRSLNDAVDHDERDDDERADDAGDGMMTHACSSCEHENTILPPRGFKLITP